MPKRDWKPVRHGSKYCSTACGCGCTYEAHLKARVAGEQLARQLGTKWRAYVWENMGWYSCAYLAVPGLHAWVTKPHWHVSKHGTRRFWADLTTKNQQWHATATTPRAAVQMVRRRILATIAIAEQGND